MNTRASAFAALLAVIGVSIVFGMILGGKLNAPQVALAAPPAKAGLELAPASTVRPGNVDFSAIVEAALPAVVHVTSARTRDESETEERPTVPRDREDWFRWFFQNPEQPERRRQSDRQPQIGEGSGFLISPDGYLLTNNHVIEGSDSVRIRLDSGQDFKADVVGTDPSIDLALLKIDTQGKRLPSLPLGDSDVLRVGEWVIAIGNPLQFEQTVTVGVVSGKGRRVPIGATDQGVASFIQTDAAINFGNSGGPLLDSRGNVIGINTAIRRSDFAEGISFALPISQATSVIEQLRERGYVRRGYIGIEMNPNGVDENARVYYDLPDSKGVIVSKVQDGGPAAQAGVQQGDIIRKADGAVIKDNLDLIAKIAGHQPGDHVVLDVYRRERPAEKGRMLQLKATLTDRGEGLEAQGERRGEQPPRRHVEEPEESRGLGLTVENLSRTTREELGLAEGRRGVVVKDVEIESEAAQKGIRPDMMLITAVNDRPIESVADWNRILDDTQPGTAVKLTVLFAQPEGERSFFVYLRAPEKD